LRRGVARGVTTAQVRSRELQNMKTQKNILAVALGVLTFIVVMFLVAAPLVSIAHASTNTPTPTNTPTLTPTLTTTPFPNAINAIDGSVICKFGGNGTYDCIQGRAGASIHLYDSNFKNTFSVNGQTGAVHAQSLTLATPMAVLAYQTPGVRMKCGEDTITGTLAIAHGMATPQFVTANLAGDANGDHARVSSVNASATVTIKVWNTALTPAAATTPVAVDWCVVGVP
jgi:hypothetical protein